MIDNKDDIFEDEWEDDLFDEIEKDTCIEVVDEDVKYVASLMQQAIDLCEKMVDCIETAKTVNGVFEKIGCGPGSEASNALIHIENFYNEFLPSLILDDDDDLVSHASQMLGSNEEVGRAFLDDKRQKILDAMEEINNK